MFETAMVDQSSGRGALSFSSSLLLQCGVVSGLLATGVYLPVAQPELPAFVPQRPLVQSVLELFLFAVTLEGVMLGVRPVALALFERAGISVLRKTSDTKAIP